MAKRKAETDSATLESELTKESKEIDDDVLFQLTTTSPDLLTTFFSSCDTDDIKKSKAVSMFIFNMGPRKQLEIVCGDGSISFGGRAILPYGSFSTFYTKDEEEIVLHIEPSIIKHIISRLKGLDEVTILSKSEDSIIFEGKEKMKNGQFIEDFVKISKCTNNPGFNSNDMDQFVQTVTADCSIVDASDPAVVRRINKINESMTDGLTKFTFGQRCVRMETQDETQFSGGSGNSGTRIPNASSVIGDDPTMTRTVLLLNKLFWPIFRQSKRFEKFQMFVPHQPKLPFLVKMLGKVSDESQEMMETQWIITTRMDQTEEEEEEEEDEEELDGF